MNAEEDLKAWEKRMLGYVHALYHGETGAEGGEDKEENGNPAIIGQGDPQMMAGRMTRHKRKAMEETQMQKAMEDRKAQMLNVLANIDKLKHVRANMDAETWPKGIVCGVRVLIRMQHEYLNPNIELDLTRSCRSVPEKMQLIQDMESVQEFHELLDCLQALLCAHVCEAKAYDVVSHENLLPIFLDLVNCVREFPNKKPLWILFYLGQLFPREMFEGMMKCLIFDEKEERALEKDERGEIEEILDHILLNRRSSALLGMREIFRSSFSSISLITRQRIYQLVNLCSRSQFLFHVALDAMAQLDISKCMPGMIASIALIHEGVNDPLLSAIFKLIEKHVTEHSSFLFFSLLEYISEFRLQSDAIQSLCTTANSYFMACSRLENGATFSRALFQNMPRICFHVLRHRQASLDAEKITFWAEWLHAMTLLRSTNSTLQTIFEELLSVDCMLLDETNPSLADKTHTNCNGVGALLEQQQRLDCIVQLWKIMATKAAESGSVWPPTLFYYMLVQCLRAKQASHLSHHQCRLLMLMLSLDEEIEMKEGTMGRGRSVKDEEATITSSSSSFSLPLYARFLHQFNQETTLVQQHREYIWKHLCDLLRMNQNVNHNVNTLLLTVLKRLFLPTTHGSWGWYRNVLENVLHHFFYLLDRKRRLGCMSSPASAAFDMDLDQVNRQLQLTKDVLVKLLGQELHTTTSLLSRMFVSMVADEVFALTSPVNLSITDFGASDAMNFYEHVYEEDTSHDFTLPFRKKSLFAANVLQESPSMVQPNQPSVGKDHSHRFSDQGNVSILAKIRSKREKIQLDLPSHHADEFVLSRAKDLEQTYEVVVHLKDLLFRFTLAFPDVPKPTMVHRLNIMAQALYTRLATCEDVPSDDTYREFLPNKSAFEYDLRIYRWIRCSPALLEWMEILAHSPQALMICLPILKSILVALIGHWHAEFKSSGKSEMEGKTTRDPQELQAGQDFEDRVHNDLSCKIIQILGLASWIPLTMERCTDYFPDLPARHKRQILFTVWMYLVENAPTLSTSLDENVVPLTKKSLPMDIFPYLIPFQAVLLDNIHLVGSKYIDYFPEKPLTQPEVSPPSSFRTTPHK